MISIINDTINSLSVFERTSRQRNRLQATVSLTLLTSLRDVGFHFVEDLVRSSSVVDLVWFGLVEFNQWGMG